MKRAAPKRLGQVVVCGTLLSLASSGQADAITPDDHIVQGSICVGIDCLNNHVFGFDTIVLRENNLRIKFDDTSSTGFPNADWELRVNDAVAGGGSFFGITDVTSNPDKMPFRLEAGAPDKALHIDSTGKVGLGTESPTVALHIVGPNTPAIRLHQTGGEFPTSAWDVAANETSFFIREGNSKLGFRIVPGTQTDTLTLNSVGVGIGTLGAQGDLHIVARRASPIIVDKGADNLMMLSDDGDLSIGGTLTQHSSVHVKENIERLDGAEVLRQLAKLNVARWSYKTDSNSTPHIGPFAEEFYAAFHVGDDAKHIAPSDASGVALAAVQALYQKMQEQEAELKVLRERVAELGADGARTTP